MMGIYQIINKINNKSYIGQSRNIKRRFRDHKRIAYKENNINYNYPLYQAIRKYGIENFSFEILEECTEDELNIKEHYYISKIHPEYNQTDGGDYEIIIQKLSKEQVSEIQNILINDQDGLISHVELAKKYNVHRDTIRDINVGRTWHSSKLKYPLHYSKFSGKNLKYKNINYCIDCNKEIHKNSIRCTDCNIKYKIKQHIIPVSREELKQLIREKSFISIGKMFNVTDNAIRKWCKKYELPNKKKDIKKISDSEWLKI